MCTYSASGGSAVKCGRPMASAGIAVTVADEGSADMKSLVADARDQAAHCDAAMRQLVLACERQLCAGQPGHEVFEMRVVAKSAVSARRIDDSPMPRAFGNQ